MRSVLVLLLVASIANSARIDSSNSLNSDWSDVGSMELAATTTRSYDVTLPDTYDVPTSAPDSTEEIPTTSSPAATTVNTNSEQDDSSNSPEERKASQDSVSDDQSTTENSLIKDIQPCNNEVQEQNQSAEEDVKAAITPSTPTSDLNELPVTQSPQYTTNDYQTNLDLPQETTISPLLERINDFPQTTERQPLEMKTTPRNDNESSEPTKNPEENQNTEQVETTTTTGPIPKRNNVRTYASATDSDETENQKNISPTTAPPAPVPDTPDNSDSNFKPSPVTIPEELSEEITKTRQPCTCFSQPGYPEVQEQNYSPESESQPGLPYYYPSEYLPSSSPPADPSSIYIQPSSNNQYYSDYSNTNRNNPERNEPPQRQQDVSPYYYTDSNPTLPGLRRTLVVTFRRRPTKRTTTTRQSPFYISGPSRYLNLRGDNSDGDDAGTTNIGGYDENIYTPGFYRPNNNYNNNYSNNNPFIITPPSPQVPSSAGRYNNNNLYGYLRY